MSETIRTEADAIAEIVAKLNPLQDVVSAISLMPMQHSVVPALAVHKDFNIEALDYLMPNPQRIKRKAALDTEDSFIGYCKEFLSDSTMVVCDKPNGSLQAIFDYPDRGTPRWCDHSAMYTLPKSDEWIRWTGLNSVPLSQQKFAEFIEDNQVDIVSVDGSPSSADMLQVALGLEAISKVNFKSGTRLDNGDIQILYQEDTQGTVRDGKTKVPSQFTIAIPVFYGGPAFRIDARLRWRIKEGKLTFWFDLYRHEKIYDQALIDIVNRVGGALETTVLYASKI